MVILCSISNINRRHNSHGYSKYRLGCFNGSLYFFPFTRSMGEKWTLEGLQPYLYNNNING